VAESLLLLLLLLVPVRLGALAHLSPKMPLQQYWAAVSYDNTTSSCQESTCVIRRQPLDGVCAIIRLCDCGICKSSASEMILQCILPHDGSCTSLHTLQQPLQFKLPLFLMFAGPPWRWLEPSSHHRQLCCQQPWHLNVFGFLAFAGPPGGGLSSSSKE
jgi:hypothetical protein